MIKIIISSLTRYISRVKKHIKQWTRPATASIVIGSLSDASRSHRDLIVLKRKVPRPQFSQGDRLRLVLLSRLTGIWQQALHIVQPDTLLRWHRDLFRSFWRRKTKSKHRKPRISQETIALIKQMARDNQRWGAERIRSELLKLGIRISKRKVQKYMPKKRNKTCQTWGTFLQNHAHLIWACDFTVVYDLIFRQLYIFVIIELQSRRIVHTAVTRTPTDEWTTQQLREATPWEASPKYLIRDRDNKYGARFAAVARGIQILITPVRAPGANSFCERFIGSLKRECLDHMFILNRLQLQTLVQEYVEYYNRSRPHQDIGQQIPNDFVENGSSSWPIGQPEGRIEATPILGWSPSQLYTDIRLLALKLSQRS